MDTLWWGNSLSLCGWIGGVTRAREKMLTCKCPLGSPSGTLVSSSHTLVSGFQDPRKQSLSILSYRDQASCSLVLQSLDPGLLTPQNVLTTEMNTPNPALPPQSLGHAPRPPIVAAEFRGWGGLKPPLCSSPAARASVQHPAHLFPQFPFSLLCLLLDTLWAPFFFLSLTVCDCRSFPSDLISWAL